MRILKRLMALRAEWCVMKGEGWKSLVLSESHIILKYAQVRPVEGRLSCDAGWLRRMSLCQTALAKVLRKFANALFLFRGFDCATWGGVCGLMYMPLRLKRVCASAVLVSIDW